MRSMIEVFERLEREAREVGLAINEGKTKYLRVSKKKTQRTIQSIYIGKYNFEAVRNFVYLGAYLNDKNKM